MILFQRRRKKEASEHTDDKKLTFESPSFSAAHKLIQRLLINPGLRSCLIFWL